ncbi:hypothetical protein NMQ14_17680 [Methyloversatilis sp. XJ19-13]|uniref:hypothetical protein n=1 Tax=Methyloversatilis sp. XJ19-13 TaxID=2963430 RepID=UPI00211C0D83|nr:hypothetical protein [Methyloversatilis sp. XJ19-13]MCQ9376082.1 hypothetical protein [Methyloversatilis sp. XJ19-13]
MMNINEWMNLLGLGLICGAIGQAVRVIAGMKKLGEEAGSIEKMRVAFVPQQFVVSLLIGAAAGALAAIGLSPPGDESVPAEVITTLIGAGYAGADFIEAFMRKALPKGTN